MSDDIDPAFATTESYDNPSYKNGGVDAVEMKHTNGTNGVVAEDVPTKKDKNGDGDSKSRQL